MNVLHRVKLGGEVVMDEARFEAARLACFRDAGVEVAARRVADCEGREIYTLVREGRGPLVLIHGGMAEGALWQPLAKFLPKDLGLVIPDRPGHGLSYKLRYEGPHFRQEAADFVRDLLDGLALERAVIVGNSMGGFFALSFALAYPERVDQLVLIGAPAGLDRPGIPWMMRPLAFGPMRHWVAHQAQSRDAARDFWGKVLVAHADRAPDAVLDLETAGAALPGNADAVESMLGQIIDYGGFRRALSLREETARLAVPTTFLWGDKDTFAPPSSGEDMARRMPNATCRVFPGTGHIPWIDEPETYARAVAELVEPATAIRAGMP